jgi:polyphosphate kinase
MANPAYEDLDLLETMEASDRKCRFGAVVRLMIHHEMPAYIRDFLIENLKAEATRIYTLHNLLVLRNLMALYKVDRPDLKFKAFSPVIPQQFRSDAPLQGDAIFAAIRKKNILVHHPYESFTRVIDFLNAAAQDPDVLAIKQTLYRVGNNSQVVRTLLQACRDYGKQVAVLVELKARFDEESNISWAKMLEQEGVYVTYGLPGLKTHSKIALVVRKEEDHIRRSVHLATGNYNHITAQMYEDFGLFTCDPDIAADASDLFNYLTGYSTKADYCKLLVAPVNMRERLEAYIRKEIEHSQNGEPAYIIFKTNALVDRPLINLLYEASQSGVKIDLIERGICTLRPEIAGLSDNIRVISIVGRFLEHSRIYYFLNAGSEVLFMGSADLMPRNLNQRVEVHFPIEEPDKIRYIHDGVLQVYLKDRFKARQMLSDNTYVRLKPSPGEEQINAQDRFKAHAQRPMEL